MTPCTEDFERMRAAEETGDRFCDACAKRVHDVRTTADARRVIRDARARSETWACIRVATAIALTSCAPQTRSVELGPIQQPSGICQIDPTACATARHYQGDVYMVGSTVIPETVWDRFVARARRLLRGKL